MLSLAKVEDRSAIESPAQRQSQPAVVSAAQRIQRCASVSAACTLRAVCSESVANTPCAPFAVLLRWSSKDAGGPSHGPGGYTPPTTTGVILGGAAEASPRRS